jgi:hypothetical protein
MHVLILSEYIAIGAQQGFDSRHSCKLAPAGRQCTSDIDNTQTDSLTDRQADRQADRQDKSTATLRDRQIDRLADRGR